MCKKHIGKSFKEAVKKHVNREHPLYGILNEHVCKLSYSMMPNMADKIGEQNCIIENRNKVKDKERMCDCPKMKAGNKYECPWGKSCLKEGWVYKYTAVSNKEEKWNYIGLTGGNIKVRISNHKWTAKKIENSKTTLSKKIIEEREKGNIWEEKWERIAAARPRKANQRNCNICSKETLLLQKRSRDNINSREEIGGYCPHRRKWVLMNIEEVKAGKRKEIARKKADKKENTITG